jgi:predicted nucleic acid-binding protein
VIVVSDTSPLNYLLLIQAIDLLPQLFQEVLVPPAVLKELSNSKAPLIVQNWAKAPPPWLTIVDPTARLASTVRLDLGEAQAISLAKERNILDILIDERRGSRVAAGEGLFPLPTLAVLERAAERKLIDLPQAIDRLKQTTMRITPEILDGALQRDAQRRQRKSP